VKIPGGGEFTTAGCQVEGAGAYEWSAGVPSGGFSSALKPATTVKMETSVSKEKVTCTGESGVGEITGAKTIGNLAITLTGCESLGGKCTTAGLVEGEIQTATLEGTLGIEKITEKLGKETVHAALDLYPAVGSGPFLEFTCSTSGTTVIDGSVIAPVAGGRMLRIETFKLAAGSGKQKPESLEGGSREVLRNALGEQVGISLTATQTNEEAVEVNTLF
jgi:hypothetical protein